MKCEECGCEDLESEFVERVTYQGLIEISFSCPECDAEYLAKGTLYELEKIS